MQHDRHVQANNVMAAIYAALKNSEVLLITASATWAWGVEPVFLED